jgi:hypothetical protein
MAALCSLRKDHNNFMYQVYLQQLILLINTTYVLVIMNHTHTQTCSLFRLSITVCILSFDFRPP